MPDPGHLRLETLVSSERLTSYRSEAARDPKRIARLYMWNIEISQAFCWPISILEVLLRNRINNNLVERFGDRWFEARSPLTEVVTKSAKFRGDSTEFLALRSGKERRHIDTAVSRLTRRGDSLPTAAEIIGATSFGLWVGLLENYRPYQRHLWEPTEGLSQSFTLPTDRDQKWLHKKLSTAQILRNRIAHHEPIHGRNHLHDFRDILAAIKTIDAPTASFVEDANSVKSCVDNKHKAVVEGDCVI